MNVNDGIPDYDVFNSCQKEETAYRWGDVCFYVHVSVNGKTLSLNVHCRNASTREQLSTVNEVDVGYQHEIIGKTILSNGTESGGLCGIKNQDTASTSPHLVSTYKYTIKDDVNRHKTGQSTRRNNWLAHTSVSCTATMLLTNQYSFTTILHYIYHND